MSGIPKLHADVRAAVHAAGSLRDPIVMLHGWGMNLAVFDLLRADLAEWETWAIDLPGHGRSPWWPEAARFEVQQRAVLAALPPRCVLLGWSFGAKLAMALAAAEAQRIARLVLVAATPRHMQAPDWPQGMDPAALRAFRAVLEQDWQRTLEDFIALQLRGSSDAEAARRSIEAALAVEGAPQRAALLAGLALLESTDLRARAPDIRQPTLIVAGRNDRVTSPAAAQWLQQHLAAARLVEIPRAGHAAMVSHHALVAAAVREFLAT